MEQPATCSKCRNGFNEQAYKSYFTSNFYHRKCLKREHFPNRISYYVHKKMGYFKASNGVIIIGGTLGLGLQRQFFQKWGWKGLIVMIPSAFLSCVAFQYFCPDQRKKGVV